MKNEIIIATEELIQQVELSIRRWMQKKYTRKIGVSVQLPFTYQGERRLPPHNNLCKKLYDDISMRNKCDQSDVQMKALAKENEISVAYICHAGLSNIVIPHYSDDTKAFWFIFLGQFMIMDDIKCDDCRFGGNQCRSTQKMLEKEGIQILNDNKIAELGVGNDKIYVQPGFFTNNNGKISNDYMLNIHQLIMCKNEAVDTLDKEIEKLSSNILKAIRELCEQQKISAKSSVTVEHENPCKL